MNQAVGVRHPSLWVFIRVLKDQHSINEVKDLAPPNRRQKWRRLETRITDLKARYNNGALTLPEYWDAIKYVILDR